MTVLSQKSGLRITFLINSTVVGHHCTSGWQDGVEMPVSDRNSARFTTTPIAM